MSPMCYRYTILLEKWAFEGEIHRKKSRGREKCGFSGDALLLFGEKKKNESYALLNAEIFLKHNLLFFFFFFFSFRIDFRSPPPPHSLAALYIYPESFLVARN